MFIQSVNVTHNHSPSNLYNKSERYPSKLSGDSVFVVNESHQDHPMGHPQVETPTLLQNKKMADIRNQNQFNRNDNNQSHASSKQGLLSPQGSFHVGMRSIKRLNQVSRAVLGQHSQEFQNILDSRRQINSLQLDGIG